MGRWRVASASVVSEELGGNALYLFLNEAKQDRGSRWGNHNFVDDCETHDRNSRRSHSRSRSALILKKAQGEYGPNLA